jgi:hypothetical protein
MANEPSKLTLRTPIIVWCVRVFLCAVVLWVGRYWLASTASGPVVSQVTLGVFIGLSGVVLIASFVHSKWSLVVVILSVIVIPLAFFLGIDIFVLQGVWWEWYMILVQMGIPLAVSYYMWKSPGVRNYFQQGRPARR